MKGKQRMLLLATTMCALGACGRSGWDYEQHLIVWESYNAAGTNAMLGGNMQRSLECFQNALNEAKVLGAKDPHLGLSYNQLSHCCAARGEFNPAQKWGQAAISVLRSSCVVQPLLVLELIDALQSTGQIEAGLGELDCALQDYQEAIALCDRESKTDGGTCSAAILERSAAALIGEAEVYLQQGKPGLARRACEKVASKQADYLITKKLRTRLETVEALVARRLSPTVVVLKDTTGVTSGEDEEYARWVRKVEQQLLNGFPAEAEKTLLLAKAYADRLPIGDARKLKVVCDLATVQEQLGKTGAALQLMERASKIPCNSTEMQNVLKFQLAHLYERQGRDDEAANIYRMIIDRKTEKAICDQDLIVSLCNLASIEHKRSENSLAIAHYQRALQYLLDRFPQEKLQQEAVLHLLVDACVFAGLQQYGDVYCRACQLLQERIAMREPNSLAVAQLGLDQARSLVSRHYLKEAAGQFEKALVILRRSGAEKTLLVSALLEYGKVLAVQGRFTAAESADLEAYQLCSGAGKPDRLLFSSISALDRDYRNEKKFDTNEQLLVREWKRVEPLVPNVAIEFCSLPNLLAATLIGTGRYQEAMQIAPTSYQATLRYSLSSEHERYIQQQVHLRQFIVQIRAARALGKYEEAKELSQQAFIAVGKIGKERAKAAFPLALQELDRLKRNMDENARTNQAGYR